MLEYLINLFASLGLDWGTLVVAAVVLVLVWLAGVSGLAKTGERRRLLGAIAALALTCAVSTLEASTAPVEILALLVPAIVAWVGSALSHAGIEFVYNKLAPTKNSPA